MLFTFQFSGDHPVSWFEPFGISLPKQNYNNNFWCDSNFFFFFFLGAYTVDRLCNIHNIFFFFFTMQFLSVFLSITFKSMVVAVVNWHLLHYANTKNKRGTVSFHWTLLRLNIFFSFSHNAQCAPVSGIGSCVRSDLAHVWIIMKIRNANI